ncbi:conserved hypothetical protein [Culex quinquefasciatus]|uniref:Uncharacterized protein n=1 Tax=Culex quinquefasciatus TaxID=7176 RepID=B0WKS2_CULQU|nr:conserved hypothetical protein [Culex quinquefasciatus]|eukprot:XP_001849306.1 conserved hypothetical protein [Culex quinquefasciatus]
MENERQVAQSSSRSRSRSRKGVNGSGVWLVEESDLDVDAFFMQRNSTFNAQAETGSGPSGRTPGGGVEASSSFSKKSLRRKSSLTFRTPEESSFMTVMSFESLQITECKPSEGEEDISKKAFEQWRSVLESAMKIAGIEEEDAKSNVFKMKAGSKLMDVLEGVSDNGAPDEDQFPYSNAMFKLEQHFSSRDFVLLRRQKLRAMVQGDGKSDFVYVKRLIFARGRDGAY